MGRNTLAMGGHASVPVQTAARGESGAFGSFFPLCFIGLTLIISLDSTLALCIARTTILSQWICSILWRSLHSAFGLGAISQPLSLSCSVVLFCAPYINIRNCRQHYHGRHCNLLDSEKCLEVSARAILRLSLACSAPFGKMQSPAFSVPPVISLEPSYKDRLPSWLSPLAGAMDSIARKRDALALPDPGKAEDLGREVKSQSSNLRCFSLLCTVMVSSPLLNKSLTDFYLVSLARSTVLRSARRDFIPSTTKQ